MNREMNAQDPTVFLQKMMENAYDQEDMNTVMAMSQQIDSMMLRRIEQDLAERTNVM